MASLIIRNLDDALKVRLRTRAASHDRSMEAEARLILRDALGPDPEPARLASRIHARFLEAGAADLELPERSDPPRRGTEEDAAS